MNIYNMRISDIQEYVNFIREENLKLQEKNKDLERINELYRSNLLSQKEETISAINELKNQIALLSMRLPIDIKV